MRAILGLLTLLVLGLVFFVVPPAEGLGYYVRLAFFHIPVAWVAVLAFFISGEGTSPIGMAYTILICNVFNLILRYLEDINNEKFRLAGAQEQN